jgi:hypothetical protein
MLIIAPASSEVDVWNGYSALCEQQSKNKIPEIIKVITSETL